MNKNKKKNKKALLPKILVLLLLFFLFMNFTAVLAADIGDLGGTSEEGPAAKPGTNFDWVDPNWKPPSQAGQTTPPSGSSTYSNQELIPGAGKTGDVVEYIKQIIRFGFAAIGILALFMLSVGAYQYLMAAANLAKIESAKETVSSALLGLVLGLTAFLILRTINPQLVSLQLSSPGGAGGGAGTPGGGAVPEYTGAAPEEIKKKVQEYANKYGISENIALALVNAESNFDPTRTSPKGAQGLMQLMPDTARGLDVTDPYDIDQNLNGGIKYLKQMYDRYNGNWEMALAAYNWGYGKLDSNGFENRPKETRDFICKILKNC